MKTRMNIRRGTWNWTRENDYALANGWRPESWLSNPSQFAFSFGAYGSTRVRVWASAGHIEDAFETAVEWLDDNAPGHLVSIGRAELMAVAADNNLPYPPDGDFSSPEGEKILELAEVDLTVIGHTTLKHGQYLHSWEWTVDELTR